MSACSSGGGSGASGASGDKSHIVVDFANGTEDGQTYKGLEDTLTTALKGVKGVTLNKYNNNLSATALFQNVSTMVAEHPNVIIEVNPIADTGARLSAQLKRSKIPCIAVNVPVDGCAFFNEDLPPMGKQLADAIAPLMKSRGWDGTNTTVIPVESAAYGSLNDGLWEFVGPLSHEVPNMKPVKPTDFTTSTTQLSDSILQVNTDYSTDAAFKTFATTLQSLPAGRHMVIDCIGDETCIGVYRALKNAGRLSDAMIMGWGTTPAGMKLLITDPAWVAESANFFSYWGEFVAPMAVAMAHGVKPPAQTVPPTTIITKDNVGKYFNADGSSVKQFPPLPSGSHYLVTDGGGILQRAGNVEGVS